MRRAHKAAAKDARFGAHFTPDVQIPRIQAGLISVTGRVTIYGKVTRCEEERRFPASRQILDVRTNPSAVVSWAQSLREPMPTYFRSHVQSNEASQLDVMQAVRMILTASWRTGEPMAVTWSFVDIAARQF